MARISVNPTLHFGKTCVAGTRIPVQSVLELVEEDIPFPDIVTEYYPDLEVEDVRACLRYAISLVDERRTETQWQTFALEQFFRDTEDDVEYSLEDAQEVYVE